MALPVLIMGRSGAGKTYSLKNFKEGEVGVISIEKGRLPFKSDIKVVRLKKFENEDYTPAQVNAARYSWLEMVIKKSTAKAVVIDDSQYLMANELFDKISRQIYSQIAILRLVSNFKFQGSSLRLRVDFLF